MVKDDRLILHDLLVELFPDLSVYYSPTSKLILEYPCIVYGSDKVAGSYAENQPYILGTTYQVTVMTTVGVPQDVKRMFGISNITHNATFTQADIIHHVYTVSINKT